MNPRDLNPALTGRALPALDPKLMAAMQKVEPAGPVLNLQAVLGNILLDMPEEHKPTEEGGIVLPAGYQKPFTPFAEVTVLSVGPDVKTVKKGDLVLVSRAQVDQIVHNGRSYWTSTEVCVRGIICPPIQT